MPNPDVTFENWKGIIDNDFAKTISETFDIPADDGYVYRAEAFAMTLPQIQEQVNSGKLKYKYHANGQQIEVPLADIIAYTTIFSPATDSSKALTASSSNAKKSSPRETVAHYLQSRRIPPAESCLLTSFLGPLPDLSYANPINAKRTQPILPVFYHHFGCVVPTYVALSMISQITSESGAEGIVDMASGNGYWTYMLLQMKLNVIAVDNMTSEYRTIWIADTVKSDGFEYLRKHAGGKGRVLLMVYMVTAGTFTKRVTQAYRGDTIVVVGTQNGNRYTGFSDSTVEEWFGKEMAGWEMVCRIAMPSFAGKDEGLFVWKRQNK